MRFIPLLLMLPLAAHAQAPLPTEFPADAAAPSAEALQRHVTGKVFRVKLHDGGTWRLEYKDGGYIFVDTNRGFRDTGRWRVEGSQLCGEWQRAPGGCSETRLKGQTLYVKRISTGEVIAFEAD